VAARVNVSLTLPRGQCLWLGPAARFPTSLRFPCVLGRATNHAASLAMNVVRFAAYLVAGFVLGLLLFSFWTWLVG